MCSAGDIRWLRGVALISALGLVAGGCRHAGPPPVGNADPDIIAHTVKVAGPIDGATEVAAERVAEMEAESARQLQVDVPDMRKLLARIARTRDEDEWRTLVMAYLEGAYALPPEHRDDALRALDSIK